MGIVGGFSGLGYSIQENPALELFSSIPFGPDPLTYAGWMYKGGGMQLLDNFLKPLNIIAFPLILIPPEASGWFKKKINKTEDLKGLKIRVYGLGRQIFKILGAKPTIIAGDKLYQSFKNGTIDAAEFSTPSWEQTITELTKKSPDFKRVWLSVEKYREESQYWDKLNKEL